MSPVASKKKTGTKSSSSGSLAFSKEDKELADQVAAACKGPISGIVTVLEILEAKQATFRGGGPGAIPRQWKFRLWNHQALLRFQLLKLAQDVICDKDQVVEESLLVLSRHNFDNLLSLPTEIGSIDENKTSELYARLGKIIRVFYVK